MKVLNSGSNILAGKFPISGFFWDTAVFMFSSCAHTSLPQCPSQAYQAPLRFIVAWYRLPKYETQTVIEMETLLNAFDNENKKIILIGDVN